MNKPLTYYNDIEHFPCEVLRKNIKLGLLPEGYVDERDIREIRATDFIQYRHIHLFAGIGCFPLGLFRAGYPLELRTLTAGFPCQDISAAGRQAGIIEGEKSSLWKEIVRLLQECSEEECSEAGITFDYILIENVRNL